MLSRKHYREIATILKRHNASTEMQDAFIGFLGRDNPKFNPDAFVEWMRKTSKAKKREVF